jgi:hypothetical protein
LTETPTISLTLPLTVSESVTPTADHTNVITFANPVNFDIDLDYTTQILQGYNESVTSSITLTEVTVGGTSIPLSLSESITTNATILAAYQLAGSMTDALTLAYTPSTGTNVYAVNRTEALSLGFVLKFNKKLNKLAVFNITQKAYDTRFSRVK